MPVHVIPDDEPFLDSLDASSLTHAQKSMLYLLWFRVASFTKNNYPSRAPDTHMAAVFVNGEIAVCNTSEKLLPPRKKVHPEQRPPPRMVYQARRDQHDPEDWTRQCLPAGHKARGDFSYTPDEQ